MRCVGAGFKVNRAPPNPAHQAHETPGGGREPEALVEAGGVGAGLVGGQLVQLASLVPGFFDGPLDELGSQAAATLVRVDAYPFDDRPGRAAPGEPGNDRELERADDPALPDRHHQALVRVGAEPLQRGQVRGEVVR